MGNTYRSPLRGAAVLSVMLVLPGCIPWPVSMALSGLSYATTGKSIGDHFLSSYVKKDCSVGRAVLDQADICQSLDDIEPDNIEPDSMEPDSMEIAIDGIDDSQALEIAPASGPIANGS